jgi:hypothetical protein
LQEAEIVENEKVLSMEEELNLILKNAEPPPLESEDFSQFKQKVILLPKNFKIIIFSVVSFTSYQIRLINIAIFKKMCSNSQTQQ